ncbi:MAG: hypothetical protein DRP45_01860 [Candidatus Zixiibacteriota bacterium]|nr:MAG: hypothetical protein DRP45_01860 [candidate division Zixibacteria bacterium]
MRVLIVEDDPVSLKLASSVLKKHGYEVTGADSGKQAISHIEEEGDVDIIVSDIMMPVMDGFTMMTYLKADSRLSRIPVVLCTALNDADSVKKALDLGAVGYLTKPINPKALVEKVRAAEKGIPGAVVIVDDEDLLRKLLMKTLTREGIHTLAAGSGEKALELIENNKIALVISDIKMPMMNGLELLVEIKENDSSIPVFLMTGHGGEFSKQNVLAAGADGYITKPFRNTEIIRQVKPYIK